MALPCRLIGVLALTIASTMGLAPRAATAAAHTAIPEGTYYFVTVPAKIDRKSPLYIPHVMEVTVSVVQGRTAVSFPGSKEQVAYEIRTEKNGMLITIPQPPYSPFGLSTGVYSATASVSEEGETPQRFDGKYWIVSGYGDDAESGEFSLILKPK